MLEAKIRRRAYEIWAQFRWLVEYEDLVQEGWLGATVGSGRYKEGRGTSLENWCFVYADGGMRNYIRREVGVLRDRDEFKGEDRVGDGVEGIELMESVWSGLRRLGIGDFEILWQYYFDYLLYRYFNVFLFFLTLTWSVG